MFGSDDNENWTQLTTDLTVVSDDMQSVHVQDSMKNQRYRFFKMQMVQPTYAIFEVGEFRIFGQRYETVNKIASVSISSAQSLKKRIVPGNTVQLAFKSREAINSVSVMVQGQPATVSTTDNVNWSASWIASASAPAGAVKFVINYKTAAGIDAEPTLFTTDDTSLFISDQAGLINPIGLTALSDSSGRNQADVLAQANLLLDNNLVTFTDFRVNGSGNGGWLKFDFKGGGQATLNRVEVIGRQDQYAGRINGTVVQGSNDNTTWDTISPASNGSSDWQTLKISSLQPYRYIRVVNGNAWYGNMSEVRMYGAVESVNMISTASLSSAQALRNRVVPGNTVKVAFTAKEAINNVSATIHGVPATVASADNINFTASAVLPQAAAPGAVGFAVNYKTQNGKDGYPNTATTDGTQLTLVDEADVIKNVTGIATLIDSTVNRPAATTLSITNSLFDSNLGTSSDYRTGTSNVGTGAYITFDFKAGNQATLTGVELAARQDQAARAKGTVVQGSNDNASWTTLTPGAVTTQDWQTLPVGGGVPYRYIRIYNGNTWFGNLAEVRFHGSVQAAAQDVSASVKMTQQGATLNRATGKYVGSVTLANTSGAALGGPLQLKLNGLTAGLTLDNASGINGGAPYITLPGPLDAGATVSVPLTFTNPARSVIAYTPALYQGSF
jgi:hypothetical protein